MIDLTEESKNGLARLELLKKEYADLFEQRNYMLQYEESLLVSLYLTLVGQFQFRLFSLKGDLSQLNQRIQLAQVYFNRNELPDWHSIDKKIEAKFKDYYRQIEAEAKKLAAAKEFLKTNFISDEDATKLKAIYKLLVKKLHPDLNPSHPAKDAELFLKVQAAYDLADLEALNEILLYLTNEEAGVPGDIPDLKKQIEKIAAVNRDLKVKIEKLNNVFPFIYRDKLKDEKWVEDERTQLDLQMQLVEKELEMKTEYLMLLKSWKPELLH
ncbi:MAG: hypothetical protein JXR27_08485 [Paludibacteraceae bacterium]|nr:hypothetical protein [Paludibacteraceae bacterium]